MSLCTRLVCSIAVSTAGLMCLLAQSAAAQNNGAGQTAPAAAPAKRPVEPDPMARQNRSLYVASLREGTIQDDKAFNDYVEKWQVAQLVLPTNRTGLPQIVTDVKTELMNLSAKGPPLVRFNERALDTAKKLLTPGMDYDDLVRINALLLISQLDQQLPPPRGQMDAGQPYPPALPVLLTASTLEAFSDPLKVAALRGVVRHARAGIPANQQAPVQAKMVELLGERTPPMGRSAQTHAWMRRRAADVLGAMKSAGNGGSVLLALAGVVADETAPIGVRTSAADALAQLDVKAMPNFNQASYAKAMLAVAAAAVDAEVARANRENQSAAPQVVKPALESVKAALAKGGAPTGPVDEALAQLADKQAMPPAELATLKQKFGSAPASGNPSGTAVPPEFQ